MQAIHKFVGRTSVTGTATVTVASFDLTNIELSGEAWDNCSARLRAEVHGRTSAGNTFSIELGGLFKRTAGTLSLVGSLVTLMALQADAALALVVVTLDFSGNLLRVRVTGVAAQTIELLAASKVTIFQP